MSELRGLLAELGVEESDIDADSRIRAHLALDSTETVELEAALRARFGVVVDLWDKHDYSLSELEERIARARE
ncbi:phosphopantetheine-binding protein [Amycolatopsis azurea]|uniref:Carrier domain-containing protein n=1 Tax=Amycolatopsis azurea DSM 43854 TaxID=1238180 RepID=M2P2F3_9PSEU|nr:phosphopantetheine-binding protein [Amycolatopsis azurea]EMD29319.1 hypothetical protein C791_5061 [Amycolatopsis azurea DSM 43854]OOC08112.1 hypothetical protein B0293_04360 [Amycolatopsis azurea DSM 43854]